MQHSTLEDRSYRAKKGGREDYFGVLCQAHILSYKDGDDAVIPYCRPLSNTSFLMGPNAVTVR